ncbi:DUF732 domain-containing protein [Microbacterium sp. S1037]|jgi:hypothetical protein|uniref:DUF732 domain-containing protein n=1 Tax=Microbacterium sp. S1037 TaxID=3398227 RepID=UPI003AAD0FDC
MRKVVMVKGIKVGICALALLLSCSGCSFGETASEPASPLQSDSAPTRSTSPDEGPSSSVQDAPNEAQPITPENEAQLAIGPEEAFLSAVSNGWQGEASSESSWIELGNNACSDLESGIPLAEVNIVNEDSDAARSNNTLIVSEAQKNLCPQFG